MTALPSAAADEPILRTRMLTKHFPIRRGLLGRTVGRVKAVDGVDLRIRPHQTVGLVGESGCGKSTLGRCILRAYEPSSGEILYREADYARSSRVGKPLVISPRS